MTSLITCIISSYRFTYSTRLDLGYLIPVLFSPGGVYAEVYEFKGVLVNHEGVVVLVFGDPKMNFYEYRDGTVGGYLRMKYFCLVSREH